MHVHEAAFYIYPIKLYFIFSKLQNMGSQIHHKVFPVGKYLETKASVTMV